MKLIRRTQEDFAMFEQAARRWVSMLGLTDWHISYKFGRRVGDQTRAASQISYMTSSRIACIRFAPRFNYDYGTIDIGQLALHEVLHLVLADLLEVAMDPKTAQSTLDTTEHALIHRLIAAFSPSRNLEPNAGK